MNRSLTIALIALICVAGGNVSAQQDARFTQCNRVAILFNPAHSGALGKNRFIGAYRMEHGNISDSPRQWFVSYDQYIRKIGAGVGLVALSDKIGNSETHLVGASYAQKFVFSDKWMLSPAVRVSWLQRSYGNNWVALHDPVIDPAIPPANSHASTIDAAVGVVLNNEQFNVGLGVNHLFAPALSFSQFAVFKYIRHYYFQTGYAYTLPNAKHITISPNILIAHANSTFVQGALSARYKWLMIGTGYNNGPMAMAGIYTDKFTIGYSYDLPDRVQTAAFGASHEVTMRYLFRWKKA